MRKSFGLISIALISSTVTWLLAATFHQPENSDFLKTTIFSYLKRMSEEGLSAFVDFKDCELERSSEFEIGQGIDMFGNCSTQTDQGVVYFSIAMGRLARPLFYDFEISSK